LTLERPVLRGNSIEGTQAKTSGVTRATLALAHPVRRKTPQ